MARDESDRDAMLGGIADLVSHPFGNAVPEIPHLIASRKQRESGVHAELPFFGDVVIEKLREVLCEVIDRRKKLVLITDAQTDLAERGAIIYLTDCKETQLRLIIDSAYVLTGEITGSSGDTCLFSGQTNFVNVFKEALHNEIKLIELKRREK